MADMKHKKRSAMGARNGMNTKPEARRAAESTARRKRGADNPLAKLDADKVRLIRQAWRDGVPMRQIAIALGINSGTVHGVVRGKTWRHVS